MTAWTRNDRRPRRCGRCGAEIPVGVLCLQLSFNGALFKKYRCAACAGPPPPDLPLHVEPAPPAPRLAFTRVGVPPFDYKERQSRASGEEG